LILQINLILTGRLATLGGAWGDSAGYTATVVQNRMIVIFGHSLQYGYLDTVQKYHFGNQEWGIIETRGYPVKGGCGHSAVLDDAELTILSVIPARWVQTVDSLHCTLQSTCMLP
jgi:hypothetical protein